MAGTTTNQKDAFNKKSYHTIPDSFHLESVSSTAGALDLADPAGDGSVPSLAGKWVYLQAVGADVTIVRGAVAIANHGEGFVLPDGGTLQAFYVDPTEETTLQHIASGVGALHILWDSKS